MRFTKSVLAIGALSALAASSPALAGNSQTVSQQYDVDVLTVPGAATGFTVKPSLPVTVTGGGTSYPFGGNGMGVGPEGYPWDTTESYYGGFVLPGAPAWGLVARVGDGPWTQVGTGPTVLSGSGELVFAMNDDLFEDNTGQFTATVSYSCKPGNGYGDKNHYHCGSQR